MTLIAVEDVRENDLLDFDDDKYLGKDILNQFENARVLSKTWRGDSIELEFTNGFPNTVFPRGHMVTLCANQPRLTLSEYARYAAKTAIYHSRGENPIYPALKLCGEAGEVAEKIGKHIRKNGVNAPIPNELKQEIAKELGDVLWYISALCHEIGITFEKVAEMNLEKLASRNLRNKIEGDGDNR